MKRKICLATITLLLIIATFLGAACSGGEKVAEKEDLPIGQSFSKTQEDIGTLESLFYSEDFYSMVDALTNSNLLPNSSSCLIFGLQLSKNDISNSYSYGYNKSVQDESVYLYSKGSVYVADLESINSNENQNESSLRPSNRYTFSYCMISYAFTRESYNDFSYTAYACETNDEKYSNCVEIKLENQIVSRFYYSAKSNFLTSNYFIYLLKNYAYYVSCNSEKSEPLKRIDFNNEEKEINGESNVIFNSYDQVIEYKTTQGDLFQRNFLTIGTSYYSTNQTTYTLFLKGDINKEINCIFTKGEIWLNYVIDGTPKESKPLVNYALFSYQINDSDALLQFEYCICNEGDAYDKCILIYQNGNLVAKFFYREEIAKCVPFNYQKAVEFLKNNLIMI